MINKYQKLFNELKSENITINNGGRSTLVIDGTNFFIRCFSAIPVLNDNGDHVGGLYGFLTSLAYTIRNFQPDRCIILFDTKGGSNRRKKIFKDYKGNRNSTPKVFNRINEFKDLIDEEESMKHQFKRVIEYLDLLPIYVTAIENIEADDAIGYIVTNLCTDDTKITIVSTDRDYLQLVNDRTQVWNPTRKKLYTPIAIHEEYLIHHENMLTYRTLTGDKSDNIPGIKGLGIKTLIKHFPQLTERNVDIGEIISECKDKSQNSKSKKIFIDIMNNVDLINLNYKLMQLSDVDISGVAKMKLVSVLNQELQLVNRFQFRKMLIEDLIHTMNAFKDPDLWLNTNFKKLEMNVRKNRITK